MKTVRIGNRKITLAGVSDSDPYYQGIGDGMEDDFARLCLMFLREDDVALDIGANIGVTAAILSQVLNKGHIHAFEPAKSVFAALERNISANNLTNVTAYNIAISDKAGHVHFAENSAYGYITTDGNAQQVRASTIDETVASLALERLDFLKIDVEGSEWAVLKGATQTINKFRPLIYVEFNSWCQVAYGKINPVDFAEWITGSFKLAHVITKSAGAPPFVLRRLMKNDFLALAHDNMVRNGCVENLVLTNDETRLVQSPTILMEELERVTKELDAITKEREAATKEQDAIIKERDIVRNQLERVLASTSWRLTAPLRYARQWLRSK